MRGNAPAIQPEQLGSKIRQTLWISKSFILIPLPEGESHAGLPLYTPHHYTGLRVQNT
ncbi:hypothetical protein TNCV_2580451 [Trichonephila clavipes]|uniref:Uncharacterized protein n=1 Tax=Trichonephila clavipes TaxID=2585209 RepID=A0A8X6SJ98_TRICX|nr:hypothetical protein TNCV_2580451 [Trichonephila clavipes]